MSVQEKKGSFVTRLAELPKRMGNELWGMNFLHNMANEIIFIEKSPITISNIKLHL